MNADLGLHARQQFARPVVLFAGGIGDALLALPSLRAVARQFFGRLTLVCEAAAYEWFFHEMRVDQYIRLDDYAGGGPSDEAEMVFDGRELGGAIGRCDLALVYTLCRSDSVVALLDRLDGLHVGLGDGLDIGYDRRSARHAVEQYFRVAQIFDDCAMPAEFSSAPSLPKAAVSAAARIAAAIPDGAAFVTVHTETKTRKRPDLVRTATLLADITDRIPSCWVLVLDASPDEVFTDCSSRVVACNDLPLDTAMSLIRHSDAFIGVDSCMLHAADMFRVPGVGLFTVTDPDEYGFYFSRAESVPVDAKGDGWEKRALDAVLDLLPCAVEQRRR